MKIDKELKYIVGFSGGPDSTFLMTKLLKEVNPENIIACHVNYNFREDSNNDQKYVEEFCEANNVKLHIKNLNCDYKEFQENFESFARSIRYDFFVETLEKENFDCIAIGHNLTDHVETFIIQKQRNSIVQYYGIKQETYYKSKKVIRPILEYTKKEILEYLDTNKIKYIIDITNFDTTYLRNKIRKELNEKIDKTELEKYLIEIELENMKLKEIKKEFEGKINDSFEIEWFLKLSEKAQSMFIFEFIKKNDEKANIENRKGKSVQEFIKQIKTDKSFIEISFGEKTFIKDREKIITINNSELEKTFIINDKKDLENVKHFHNFESILKVFEKIGGPIFVSNDFKEYQVRLSYKNKKINDYYKKRKTSYLWKIKNAVVFTEGDNLVLNDLYY